MPPRNDETAGIIAAAKRVGWGGQRDLLTAFRPDLGAAPRSWGAEVRVVRWPITESAAGPESERSAPTTSLPGPNADQRLVCRRRMSEALADGFGLDEVEQVVGSARLGVGAAQLDPGEGMDAHQRAGALA